MLLAAAFCIGSSLRDLRAVYCGLGLALGVSGVIAIAQMFGFAGIYQYSVPGGLFINGNVMAEIAVLVLVGAVAERMWWLIPLVMPAALLPMARGPILALLVALVLWARCRLVIFGVVAATALTAAVSLFTGYRMASVGERLGLWIDTLSGVNFVGHGIGSFHAAFPGFARHTNLLIGRPEHAHNDLLEFVFEVGLCGAALAVLLFALSLVGGRDSDRLVLVAFGVEAMFGFPFHMPLTAFVVALAAGRVCSDGADLRIHSDVGRA